jgi:hypothetical protein
MTVTRFAGAHIVVALFVMALIGLLPAARAQARPAAGSPAIGPVLSDGGPDISGYISPAIDPDAQFFLRTYMNAFSRETRERIASQPFDAVHVAIVDGNTNTVYYNHPEDAGSLKAVLASSLPGGDVRPDSQVFPDPAYTPGNGPYRRVYTDPVKPSAMPVDQQEFQSSGTYWIGGTATVDCSGNNFAGDDTGYVDLGGWSSKYSRFQGSDNVDTVVDAGLILVRDKSEYEMFLRLGEGPQALGWVYTGNEERASGDRIYLPPTLLGCQTVVNKKKKKTTVFPATSELYFAIHSVNELRSVNESCYSGTGNGSQFIGSEDPDCDTYMIYFTSTTGIIAWVSPKLTYGGWATQNTREGDGNTYYSADTTCGGCIFKWETGILQLSGEKMSDGSTYTAQWTGRSIAPWALGGEWPDGGKLAPLASILNCTEYPLWEAPFNPPYNKDCVDTPNKLKGTAQSIAVTGYAPTGETDSIELKY